MTPASSSADSMCIFFAFKARFKLSQAAGCAQISLASIIKKPPLAKCKAPGLIKLKSVVNVPKCCIRSIRPTKFGKLGCSK